MKNALQTPLAKKLMLAIGILLAVLIVFQAGMIVGYRKAIFSSRWNDMYSRRIDDPRSAFAPFIHMSDEPNPHGAFGEIISVRLPLIMVKGVNTAEQIVIVASSTTIRQFHAPATLADLVAGKQLIIIGTPNDQGQLVASFIRILPQASSSVPQK